jgi:hypothetical protein
MTHHTARPKDEDVKAPWRTVDCYCKGPTCEMCDQYGWYYRNSDTGDTVSEMMRGAFERHG